MAFERITQDSIESYGVQSAPDVLDGTPQENKSVFDQLVAKVLMHCFNGLLDALEAQTGAAGLGAEPFPNVTGGTLQGQLRNVQENLEQYRRELAAPAGASGVGAEPFGIVAGETVQGQLCELLGIHEKLRQADGAAYIGAEPFRGARSQTVQGQLEDVQKNVDALVEGALPVDSVTERMLSPGCVSTGKVAHGAVTTGKLADGAVTADKLAEGSVGQRAVSPQTFALLTALRPGLPDRSCEIQCGRVYKKGIGWDQVWFDKPMSGVPVVQATVELLSLNQYSISGAAVELLDVTRRGFKWNSFRPSSSSWAGAGDVVLHYTAIYRGE